GYNCELDGRGETFSAGMTREGEAGYVFTLEDSQPSPPRRGDHVWTVAVTGPGGEPAAGLDVLPCMPDHNHGSPLGPIVTADGEGRFTVERVNLWMPGLWDLSLAATDGDLEPRMCNKVVTDPPLDSVVFRFCVD